MKFKKSRAEYITNIVLFSHVCILIFLIVSLGFINYGWSSNRKGYDYLFYGIDNFPLLAFQASLSYYLNFNELIPLSLVISLEVVKIIQTAFINYDTELCSITSDQQGKCLNFTLHEDLGAIKHIFTDKTGTLTCNKLTFRGLSIGFQDRATKFENKDDEVLMKDIRSLIEDQSQKMQSEYEIMPDIKTMKNQAQLLITGIALCNEVVVVQTKNGPEYHGQSTDEINLLDMAKRSGYEMIKRVNDDIQLRLPDREEDVNFKILQKFDFNSDRKRMSVIV